MLESSTDSVNFSLLYTGNNISYIDSLKLKNKKYYYRIKSCNSNGCSTYSEIISAKTFDIINYNCLNIVYEGVIKNVKNIILGRKIYSRANHILNDLELEAGQFIVLNPGFQFQATNQNTFKALIEGCID